MVETICAHAGASAACPAIFSTIVAAAETQEQRQERFTRIRRIKWFLRFMPRRARLQHYPLIGRFADFARKRDYLWSFRSEAVRPALYAGAIIALLPLLGIQMATTFLTALLTRSNVMLLVGIQFITTPITAPPVYYATYQVGRTVMQATGFGPAPGPANEAEVRDHLDWIGEGAVKPTHRFGTTIIALVIGGVIVGAVVGLALDIAWRLTLGKFERRRLHRAEDRIASGSTHPLPPAE